MRGRLRRARVRAARTVLGLVRSWRGSLQARVTTTTLALGLVAVLALGMYLSEQISAGLFEQRRDEVLAETQRATEQAEASLDSATASSTQQVQTLMYDVVGALTRVGSEDRDVFLLEQDGNTGGVFVNDVVSDTAPELRDLISTDLRHAVEGGTGQWYQSVAVPTGDGRTEAGLVVGSTVSVPAAGQYGLYFLYRLGPEQQTLDLVQGVLAVGGVALILVLGGMTWLVTHQVVRPVRAAADVAERLADGHLDERMTVQGRDELATLGRSFNEMAASLQDQIRRMEELSTLQRRFVSDVSHELRTPLTTIRMAGEVLHAGRADLDPALARSAELLKAQLDRFEDLLADLLEISRFDAGAAVLDVEERDVREIVTRAVDQAAPLAERRGVWLDVQLGDVACTADVDPRRVERILRNLLVNAIEHAEGSPVRVLLGADPRAVAVVVRDRGVGMTSEEVEHVFDRFWRADPARARTTGGTGLGLSISREDARLHGGRLQAWGSPGRGASFRLTLPRRAGIALTGSPLPLVPSDAVDDAPLRDAASASGPAALPDLSGLEA